MTDEEILQRLSNLEKKIDKLTVLNQTIAKALHLLPVTEKEEEAIQLRQRKSLAIAAKVNDKLNVMENKKDDTSDETSISIGAIMTESAKDVYSGIIGDEFFDEKVSVEGGN